MNYTYYDDTKKNLFLFIILPILMNILFAGFYFSGIDSLQQIISPNNGFLTRESGVLEQLQNLYLLTIFIMFSYLSVKRSVKGEKILFGFISILFLFLFLEEIDYGINLYEFFMDTNSINEVRNWHNESANGKKQNVHYFKQLIDLANVIWFIIIPLIISKIKVPFIKSLAPHRFFIIGFLLTAILSSVTHSLDDIGLSIINGAGGSLAGNISEFREHNTYYLYLLYAIQIANTKLTLSFKTKKQSI
ncbi:MAG: hypothetical protein U9Q29_00870 [Campylobacterota bacterium]|nr:hypothetical protein [Campylobacterota bacterium]